MDLSQRRAAAVVAALTTRFSVGKDRLTPVGVSFASPVAPNKTDDGRAKNRRVALVDNAVALRQMNRGRVARQKVREAFRCRAQRF